MAEEERRTAWGAFKDFASGLNALIATFAAVVATLLALGIVKATDGSSSASGTHSPSSPASSSHLASKSPTSSVTSHPGARVQNVYNEPADRGMGIVRTQGFLHLRSERVCSNSVSPGNIREVILDDHAPTIAAETVEVGEQGSVGPRLPYSTPLMFKISDGPCTPATAAVTGP